MPSGMTQATYRIIAASSGVTIEITRPGEIMVVAEGFASVPDAKSWIEEDKRITGIDDRQKPTNPPHLRLV
jgi:hypothetical protein